MTTRWRTKHCWAPQRLPLSPSELLQHFIELAPAFESQWQSEHNCHRDEGGSFTLHGVCAEFSVYFRHNLESFPPEILTCLFAFIESHVADPDNADSTSIDNALCTCFLENIASEPSGETAKPFMGANSRAYFDQWHHPSAT